MRTAKTILQIINVDLFLNADLTTHLQVIKLKMLAKK